MKYVYLKTGYFILCKMSLKTCQFLIEEFNEKLLGQFFLFLYVCQDGMNERQEKGTLNTYIKILTV